MSMYNEMCKQCGRENMVHIPNPDTEAEGDEIILSQCLGCGMTYDIPTAQEAWAYRHYGDSGGTGAYNRERSYRAWMDKRPKR